MSILLYSIIIVVLRILFLQRYIVSDKSVLVRVVEAFQFFILAGVFLIVVLVNVISLVQLYFSQSSYTESRGIKRKATVTVMIISVIFYVCNIGSVIMYGATAMWNYFLMPLKLIEVSYYILLPLNSACNPVVYFIRKKDMRTYVQTLWSRFAGCVCRTEEGAGMGIVRYIRASIVTSELNVSD